MLDPTSTKWSLVLDHDEPGGITSIAAAAWRIGGTSGNCRWIGSQSCQERANCVAKVENVTAIQSESAQRAGFKGTAFPSVKQSAHFCHVGRAFIRGERNEAFRQQQRQNQDREIEFD